MQTIFLEDVSVHIEGLKLADRLAILVKIIKEGCSLGDMSTYDCIETLACVNYVGVRNGEITFMPTERVLSSEIVLYLIGDDMKEQVNEIIQDRNDTVVDLLPAEKADWANVAYILATYRDNTDEYKQAYRQVRELDKLLHP